MQTEARERKGAVEALSEAERLAFARQVVRWKLEGRPVRWMAAQLGLKPDTLRKRTKLPWFTPLELQVRAELQAARGVEEKAEESVDAAHARLAGVRPRMERLVASRGIEFLESCLAQDEHGKFVSRADARYAVDRLLRATGLDEAEDRRRCLGDIKIGVIMAQMATIRASDAKFHAVTVKALPPPTPNGGTGPESPHDPASSAVSSS